MDLIERPDEVGARHPWEVARARFFLRLLQRMGLLPGTGDVLDVGAGDAWLARQVRQVLPPARRLVCWDLHYPTEGQPADGEPAEGIDFTATRPEGTFTGILMLDVIEHVEDDRAFVTDIVETLLAPGGWVLVSVPAYQSLFCDHDRALRHFRRYSPAAIAAVLRAAGLELEVRGGLFHALLPVRAAQVLRQHRRPPAEPPGIGAWRGGAALTSVLTTTLDAETRLSLALGTRRLPLLPGLSTWALCRRAGADR